jgi:hypothetical protein
VTYFLVKLLLVVGLLKLSLVLEKPLLCSLIYTGFSFLYGILGGYSLVVVLISTGIHFVLSAGYFWFLGKFAEQGETEAGWWAIAIIGGPFI